MAARGLIFVARVPAAVERREGPRSFVAVARARVCPHEAHERSFGHVLDRGGMRAWLRGRENIHKRCLVHVAGFNLGVLMRAPHGSGDAERGRSAPLLFSSCKPTILWFSGPHRRRTRRARRHHRPRAKRNLKSAPPQRAGKWLGKYQFAAAWREVKGNNGNRRKRSGAKAETFGCFKKEAGEKTRVSASSGNT